jgi:malonyl-CoA/methylmalonyl-CoA synthetase
VYTSGTTGHPKGVPLSHRNLQSNATTLVRAWAFRPEDVLLHALPVFHVHGLFVALHCALLAGAGIHLLPAFAPAAVRAALAACTVMMGVPTFYSRLLALPGFSAADCARVRLFVSGSAPLSEGVFHAFEARTGHRILERYGMTETNMIASNPLHGDRIPGTVGYPLPGVSVRLRRDRQSVAPGDVGMLEVRGPNVFAGYHNRPQVNAREFTTDGWFRTGDLARQTDDGRITLVGRARDLIISGGFNVYPPEVERCLDGCPGVRESAVIGVPHADLGEAVVAVIVAEDDMDDDLDEASLRRHARAALTRYKQPRRYVRRAELPRNAMGKVQKQQLREELAELFASP